MHHSPNNVSDAVEGHGQGAGALVLTQIRETLAGVELLLSSDDISRPTEWRIREERPTFVVHLGGRMDRLETELEGHGGSCGTPLPGEVWSIPAGARYTSRAVGGRIDYMVFYLGPKAEGGGHPECRVVAGRHDPVLHQAARRLRSLLNARDDLAGMRALALTDLVESHLRQYFGNDPSSPAKPSVPPLTNAQAKRLRDYVHDKLGTPIRLEDLARVAGLGLDRLLPAFRRSFGISPWQYVIQQRLRQARRLLRRSPGLGITNIALECGFSSHSHLSTTFKKNYGCPPCDDRGHGPEGD